jgi:hypothetical protein
VRRFFYKGGDMSKAYSEKIYNKEKLLLLVESGKTIIISSGLLPRILKNGESTAR